MTEVKVKARGDDIVRFPGVCAHCAQPATARLTVRKRIGRVSRWIEAPLCTECARTVGRRSAAEERLQKLGYLAAAVIAVLVLAITLLLTPGGMAFALRLLAAAVAAVVAATAVWFLFRRAREQAALPQKKAILAAVRIETFSWRATTFTFENSAFAERFRTLNESILFNYEGVKRDKLTPAVLRSE